jgi:hypothetical protein
MTNPFIIKQDFLSPKLCERILADIETNTPNYDLNGLPQKIERSVLRWEQDIAERVREIIPDIEQTYDARYESLATPVFQRYPENPKAPAEQPGCENARYVRKKWVQHKAVDLVGFIWLKDYNEKVPLDPRHEVFGGKLEFPVYNFSLMPQRGTLVLYPAGPHFISLISPLFIGDLYQVKLNIQLSKNNGPWIYQPANFKGTWQEWFNEFI